MSMRKIMFIIMIVILFYSCSNNVEKISKILLIDINNKTIKIKCTSFYISTEEHWGKYSYKIYCYDNMNKVLNGVSNSFIFARWEEKE